MRRTPTALVAAASLIAGYAVAVASGSRPLGGVVLALGGLWCARRWLRDHGRRTAVVLSIAGLVAFAASHVLALAIGAWGAVLVASALAAAVIWRGADARGPSRSRPLAPVAVPVAAPPKPPAPGASPGAEPARG